MSSAAASSLSPSAAAGGGEYAIGDVKKITVDELIADLKKHPAFFDANLPPDAGELPPLLEAIRQIKYDEEGPPDHVASVYKEDGNVSYRQRDFRRAIACYEKALSAKPTDTKLIVDLYNNLAVSHEHLKNYGSMVRHARRALDYDAGSMKSYARGASALLHLDKIDQATTWIEQGLKIEPKNPTLVDLYTRARADRDLKSRNERMKAGDSENLRQLKQHIRDARVKLVPPDPWAKDCVAKTPSGSGGEVHLANDEQHSIVWPVRILFPELQVQEFIDEVSEYATFEYVLKTILEDNKPPWRPSDGRYDLGQNNNILVAMEDATHTVLHKFSPVFTLRDAFARDDVAVQNALPTLLVYAKSFADSIESTYLLVKNHEAE